MCNDIIEFLKEFDFPAEKSSEDNIFDTGLYNMYENPFTEILSFILNKNSPYANRTNFIKYFIFELTRNKEICESFCQDLNIDTQIYTRNGKIMDMVLFNNTYAIAIENKIGHIPVNPFKEYEKEIRNCKIITCEKIKRSI